MSAPSTLAKNLRTIGEGLCLAARTGARTWDTLVRSPYRRTALGMVFAVLPISVAISAYSLYPSDAEQEARAQQTIIEDSLPIPSIADQINVVTSNEMLTTHTTVIRRNDTLSAIFSRLNIDDAALQRFIRQQSQAQALSTAHEGVYVQAKVTEDRKAQSLTIFLENRNDDDPDTAVNIVRHGSRFTIDSSEFTFETQQAMSAGIFSDDIEASVVATGVPEEVARQIPVALERKIKNGLTLGAGDEFRLIYERKFVGNDFVRTGKLLAISVSHEGQTIESFWADDGTRNGGFYNLDGTTNQIAFIRVPVEGARVTSSFMPMRRHPVTGVLRPHQGTDFGAPRGNRIFAAADGVVSRVAFDHDGFGHYIMIKHDEDRTTLYAHMTRVANKLKVGDHVKRGDVVGFVGSTGLATGPHLHYELRYKNRQVNPLKISYPDKERLTDEEHQQLLAAARPLTGRLALLNRIQSVKPLNAPEAVAQQSESGKPRS